MGRYAQQRRRGGDAPPPPSAPPVSIVTVQAQLDDSTVNVEFDGPVAPGSTSGGNPGFRINGGFVQEVVSSTVDTILVRLNLPSASGDAWDMPSQPDWLLTPAVLPESGTVE